MRGEPGGGSGPSWAGEAPGPGHGATRHRHTHTYATLTLGAYLRAHARAPVSTYLRRTRASARGHACAQVHVGTRAVHPHVLCTPAGARAHRHAHEYTHVHIRTDTPTQEHARARTTCRNSLRSSVLLLVSAFQRALSACSFQIPVRNAASSTP